MENKLVKKDIAQLNENIKVLSMSSVIVMSIILLTILSIIVWLFLGTMTEKSSIKGVIMPAIGTSEVTLPTAGIVRDIFVHEGEQVSQGQKMALVDIDQSLTVITAATDGTVFSIKQEQENFDAFEPIVHIAKEKTNLPNVMLLAYCDIDNLKDVAIGQEVQVWPSNQKVDEVGYVKGRVQYVGKLPASEKEIENRIGSKNFTTSILTQTGANYEIGVYLETSVNNPSQLNWTFEAAAHPDMTVGTICDAIIVTHTYSIFEYLFLKAKATSNTVKTWLN